MKKSIFINIDSELEELANELNGRLEKDRPNEPSSLITFEERRIYWEMDGIHQGILIQPTFEIGGVNEKLWNVVITSFHWKKIERSSFIGNIITKTNFSFIEHNLRALLNQGIEKLTSLEEEDYRLF